LRNSPGLACCCWVAMEHGRIYRLIALLWVQDGDLSSGPFDLAILVAAGIPECKHALDQL